MSPYYSCCVISEVPFHSRILTLCHKCGITPLSLIGYMPCSPRFCYRNRRASYFPPRPLETLEMSQLPAKGGRRGACGAQGQTLPWSCGLHLPPPEMSLYSQGLSAQDGFLMSVPNRLAQTSCDRICRTEDYPVVEFAFLSLPS